MRCTWLAICLFFIPVLAMAQIDQGPDGIGIYFDEGALTVETDAAPDAEVHAYVILANPSQTGSIMFWHTIVRLDPNNMYFGPASLSGTPRAGSNEWVPMPGQNYEIAFFTICTAPDLPSLEPVTVLADLTIHLFGETGPVPLFIGQNAAYCQSEFTGWGQDDLITCTPSSGATDLPVASVNGDEPIVESRDIAWGAVKALFR